MKNILQAKSMTVLYSGHVAVDDVNLTVREGEMLCMVGPNGAGKTSLFRAILGLQSYSGKIEIIGHGHNRLRSLLPLIGYVPQKIAFEPNFPATVYDIVSMGIASKKMIRTSSEMIKNGGWYHTSKDDSGTGRTAACACPPVSRWYRTPRDSNEREEKIYEVIKMVGLNHLQNRRISELSEGQRQCAFIAKALINEPMLLILDEPSSSIDAKSTTMFYNIVRKINAENGITVIWSTHDLEAVKNYAITVAYMNKKLLFHDTKEKFFENDILLKRYTESAIYNITPDQMSAYCKS